MSGDTAVGLKRELTFDRNTLSLMAFLGTCWATRALERDRSHIHCDVQLKATP